jgi:hypothetical protein
MKDKASLVPSHRLVGAKPRSRWGSKIRIAFKGSSQLVIVTQQRAGSAETPLVPPLRRMAQSEVVALVPDCRPSAGLGSRARDTCLPPGVPADDFVPWHWVLSTDSGLLFPTLQMLGTKHWQPIVL